MRCREPPRRFDGLTERVGWALIVRGSPLAKNVAGCQGFGGSTAILRPVVPGATLSRSPRSRDIGRSPVCRSQAGGRQIRRGTANIARVSPRRRRTASGSMSRATCQEATRGRPPGSQRGEGTSQPEARRRSAGSRGRSAYCWLVGEPRSRALIQRRPGGREALRSAAQGFSSRRKRSLFSALGWRPIGENGRCLALPGPVGCP